MPDIDAFLDALRDEITDLAGTHLQEMQEAALKDGEAFLNQTQDNLKRWGRLLEQGELSQDEFESLVRGQKDLAEMEALKQAGLAAVRAEQFRDALIDRIIGTAGRILL
ncbi:hypothetical protein [Salinibacter grassmerensis]|uniref:hypothetical protein n=1 Tax=Salinibacter grassmerensis TaxID=3040353 RepID=UPI0021E75617|nr:hypothetical protein [Salinibacter grassmerensis]